MKRGGILLFGGLAIAGVLYRPAARTKAPEAGLLAEQSEAHKDQRSQKQPVRGSPAEVNKEETDYPCTDDSGPFQELQKLGKPETSVPTQPLPQIENSLIVTLPDPVHTELAMMFDEGVQSIERALTKTGYDFDRYWIPWQADAEPAEPDCAHRKWAERARERREKQPGLMLFRKPGKIEGQTEFLAVFLVGEAPTSGISEDQFDTAISMIRGVRNSLPTSETQGPVRVVGPTFSGSVASLIEAIRRQSALHFKIVSGSITSRRAVFDLTNDPTGLKGCPPLDSDPGRNITACVTTVDDEEALCKFAEYIDDTDSKTLQLATITEEETAYGRAGQPAPELSAQTNPKPIVCTPYRVLALNFPRGLSWLRSAYQENLRINSGNPSTEQILQRLLPMNLANEPNFREDHVPIFSKVQTPAEQESQMLQLATTLRWRHIKYAVIAATDPLDAMFVIRFLHSNTPDTRLAVLSPDLLYLRVLDDLPLEGMLAITYAPLFPPTQRWFGASPSVNPEDRSGSTPGPIPFRSNFGEGLYNAILIILDPETRNVRDMAIEEPAKSEAPGGATMHPRLWLMMVGHSAYLPIALIDKDVAQLKIRTLKGIPDPALWTICYWCLVVACVLHSVCVLVARTGRGRDRLPKWIFAVARLRHDVADSGGLVVARTAYGLVMTLALSTLLAIVAAPAIRLGLFLSSDWGAFWLAGGLLFIALFYLFAVFRFSKEARGLPANHKTFLFFVTVTTGFAVALIFWWFMPRFHNLFADNFQLFYYRSLQLSSGVSPLLPICLLLIAVLVWCVTSLRALHQLTYQPDWVPPCENFRFESSTIKLDRARAGLPVNWKSALLGVFVIGLAFLAAGSIFNTTFAFSTVEKGSYDVLFLLAFAVLGYLLFGSLARLWYVWRHLHTVLIGLSQLPLRQAFTRLPRNFFISLTWGHAGKTGDPFESTVAVSNATIECLKKLKFIPRPPAEMLEFNEAYSSLKKEYDLLMDDLAQHDRQTSTVPAGVGWVAAAIAWFSRLRARMKALVSRPTLPTNSWLPDAGGIRKALRDMTLCVRGILADRWAQGISESLDGEAERKLTPRAKEKEFQEDQFRLVAEEFMALRYVAYIRSIVAQMRCDLLFISVGYILTVLALWSYPFQSRHTIGWITGLMSVILGAGVLKVLVEMERDGVLSRLSDTQEGKLSAEFYLRLVTYGALPLLTLISAYFPSVSQFLLSWLEPSLQALK